MCVVGGGGALTDACVHPPADVLDVHEFVAWIFTGKKELAKLRAAFYSPDSGKGGGKGKSGALR